MTGEEEDDVALLVLDGHDVQQAPEGARMLPVKPIYHLLRVFITSKGVDLGPRTHNSLGPKPTKNII